MPEAFFPALRTIKLAPVSARTTITYGQAFKKTFLHTLDNLIQLKLIEYLRAVLFFCAQNLAILTRVYLSSSIALWQNMSAKRVWPRWLCAPANEHSEK